MPTVSVLMSVYNGQPYLSESIESILVQDFQDIEFLIVDDCSTDDSLATIEEAAARDCRIRVLRNEQNIGLTKSLNRGLSEARGEFVARIDADDISDAARLSRQVAAMSKAPDLIVTGTVMRLIDAEGQETGRTEAFDCHTLPAQLFFFNSITHSSVMFRRAPIQALGGYDESLVRAQDYDLWLKCLAAGYRLEVMDEVQ